MRKTIYLLHILSTIAILSSCGSDSKQGNDLASKKAALEKLKTEQNTLAEKITVLQNEINILDTANTSANAKLINITPVARENFVHYIDLQGNITSDNISYVSPRMGGGQVRAIYVKRGDIVSKGQQLIKLDDAVIRQSVIAAQKSIETVKSQLNFAKDLYNRQNNLWKEGIGTEVQLISAKNNVQSLERQLAAAEEQIKVTEEQLRATNIVADVSGIVDELNVRVGEIFVGLAGITPQIKIVNTQNMKVVTRVPENYSNRIKAGANAIISLPDLNKEFKAKVTTASRSIDANTRSFDVEIKIPYDANIRPNQLAQVKFQDYEVPNAISINVNTVQTEEKGKYVYIAVQEGKKIVARKKMITVGELYGRLIEVKTGLNEKDLLITEGYQNIYDGQTVKVLAQ
ncbi:MAG: efflux transporter periplasmic adaptor subunit [Sphingobacteriia bacterium 28-36-52]|nr:MAG: efflux transporter periplasmic adaptor subunit [Sphingobacteriia bacterium 28-36-52]